MEMTGLLVDTSVCEIITEYRRLGRGEVDEGIRYIIGCQNRGGYKVERGQCQG